MRISDWSSDVCSSDLSRRLVAFHRAILCLRLAGGGDFLVGHGTIGMAEKLPAGGSSGGAPGRGRGDRIVRGDGTTVDRRAFLWQRYRVDRKSTRLNSSP